MSSLQTLTSPECIQLLTDAIAKRYRAVITLQRPDGWMVLKAAFDDGSHALQQVTARVQPPECGSIGPNLADDARIGQVGVTFRNGRRKCLFAANVLSINGGSEAWTWTLSWPSEIRQMQRRAFERVQPPRGKVVPVKFWREGAQVSPTEGQAHARHGQLVDISAGGMRVKTGDLKEIEVGGSYRCVLSPAQGGPSIVLDARLRHRESAQDGRAALGFQFLGLESTEEGRKVLARLARLVAQYQRVGGKRGRPAGPPANS